jgi:hypothetical protein
MTGMKKKTVIKRIPLLVRNGAAAPQLLQRMGCGLCPEPHVKKRVPMIRKNIRAPLLEIYKLGLMIRLYGFARQKAASRIRPVRYRQNARLPPKAQSVLGFGANPL